MVFETTGYEFKSYMVHHIENNNFDTLSIRVFLMKIFIFLIFGLAESESWRIEVYQSCYYDLGLDNKIKQMVGYEKEVKINVDYVDCAIKYVMIKELAHNEI